MCCKSQNEWKFNFHDEIKKKYSYTMPHEKWQSKTEHYTTVLIALQANAKIKNNKKKTSSHRNTANRMHEHYELLWFFVYVFIFIQSDSKLNARRAMPLLCTLFVLYVCVIIYVSTIRNNRAKSIAKTFTILTAILRRLQIE